ncbi:hypothetical protein EBR96_01955 [bacterium]|nr:hypothetical protein [bacterium]
MQFVFRFRWFLLGLLIFTTAIATFFLPTALKPDNSLAIWFLKDDPHYRDYNEFHEKFGNDELIALLVEVPKSGATVDFAKKIKTMIRQLESVDGVQHVNSVFNIQDAFETSEGLQFKNLISPNDLNSNAELQARFDSARSNRITKEKFISADGRHLMLWIQLKSFPNFDSERTRIVHDIQNVVQRQSGFSHIPIGGLSVIYTALNDLTQRDIAIFFSAAYLLIFAVLWGIFRKLPLVFGAMCIAVIGIVCSLGLYGAFGYRLNMLTAMLPTVIIVIGVADVIHLPALYQSYSLKHPEESSEEITIRTLRSAFLPCFLTCLTNMVGFVSLAAAPMLGLRQFGIFSAVGIGISLLATFSIMAVLLPKFPPKFRSQSKKDVFETYLESVLNSLIRRPKTITMILGVIVCVSIVGVALLKIDTYTLGYLPKTAQSVRDHEEILSKWGDYAPLEITLKPTHSNTILTADIMAKTEEFRRKVLALPEVNDVYALPIVYRRMEEVISGKSTEPQPLSQPMIEQLSLIIDSEDLDWDRTSLNYRSNFMSVFTTEDRDTGRITLTAKTLSANQLEHLWEQVEKIGRDVFKDSATINPSGYGALYSKISQYIIESQINSFFYSSLLVFLILFAWTRSLRLAIIGLIPNVFPVVVMIGTMGYLNIPLDLGTAMVASIILGVVTDDTVHFLYHWKENEGHGLTWEENVKETFHFAGRSALLTSILLTGGFPIMMLSKLKTVFYFGFLTTFSAGIAVFADLYLMPLLLKIRYARNQK